MASLLGAVELVPHGPVQWGRALPNASGVYVVSLGSETTSDTSAVSKCPTSLPAICAWIERRNGDMTLDGVRATPAAVAQRMRELWLPDEVVLYVGKADTSMLDRVRAYYVTRLGKRRPHAGGRFRRHSPCWMSSWVHYSFCDDPEEREAKMLGAFVDGVSTDSRARLHDPDHPFPFANLEWRPCDPTTGRRRRLLKRHGLKGDTEPKVPAKRDAARS